MKRIFISLASVSILLLGAAFVLGMSIEDAKRPTEAAQSIVTTHFLTAVAALVFAALLHAIWLTYFVGTGRWLEETSVAYHLPARWTSENRSLKFRVLPVVAACLLLLIVTGAIGASVDPASSVNFTGFAGLSGEMVHFLTAATTISFHLLLIAWEYQAIDRNGELIEEVLDEVRGIREQRGLPV